MLIYYFYRVAIKKIESVPDTLEVQTFRTLSSKPRVKFTQNILESKSLKESPIERQAIDILKTIFASIAPVQLKLSSSISLSVPKINLKVIEASATLSQFGGLPLYQDTCPNTTF